MANRYLYMGTEGPVIWDTADKMPDGVTSVAVLRLRTAELPDGSDLLVLYADGTITVSGSTTPVLDSSSNQVVGDRKAAVPDASAVPNTGANAGSDTIDRATFNTDMTALVNKVNAIKDQLNLLLSRLRASTGHGLIA